MPEAAVPGRQHPAQGANYATGHAAIPAQRGSPRLVDSSQHMPHGLPRIAAGPEWATLGWLLHSATSGAPTPGWEVFAVPTGGTVVGVPEWRVVPPCSPVAFAATNCTGAAAASAWARCQTCRPVEAGVRANSRKKARRAGVLIFTTVIGILGLLYPLYPDPPTWRKGS